MREKKDDLGPARLSSVCARLALADSSQKTKRRKSRGVSGLVAAKFGGAFLFLRTVATSDRLETVVPSLRYWKGYGAIPAYIDDTANHMKRSTILTNSS